jgi:hypothetical protein
MGSARQDQWLPTDPAATAAKGFALTPSVSTFASGMKSHAKQKASATSLVSARKESALIQQQPTAPGAMTATMQLTTMSA